MASVMFVDNYFTLFIFLLYGLVSSMFFGPGCPWRRSDGGCGDFRSSHPPVKTQIPRPQLPYRLPAQPLRPSSGTGGSRRAAASVRLHRRCAQIHLPASDRLPIVFALLSSLCQPFVGSELCLCLFFCLLIAPTSSHLPVLLVLKLSLGPHFSTFSLSSSPPVSLSAPLPPSPLAV